MKPRFKRLFKHPESQSYFLFGPRGTGKSSLLREFSESGRGEEVVYVNLLESQTARELSAYPERLGRYLLPQDKASGHQICIIDEVQTIPPLMNEVHRLIEESGCRFILSGSSARELKVKGTNLLAGRALTEYLHPFTPRELGSEFNFQRALKQGLLPQTWDRYLDDYEGGNDFLQSYVTTYLKEEISNEGLTRNLGTFSRFLEIAAFSQAAPLEVDLILYGEKGLYAFEIKRSAKIRSEDLKGGKAFLEDYPIAKIYLAYGGDKVLYENGIVLAPMEKVIEIFLEDLAVQ